MDSKTQAIADAERERDLQEKRDAAEWLEYYQSIH